MINSGHYGSALIVVVLVLTFQLGACFHSSYSPLRHVFHGRFVKALHQLSSQPSSMEYPQIINTSSENSSAFVKVCIPADLAQKAFQDTCTKFVTQAKLLGETMFNSSSTFNISSDVLLRVFGEDKIKRFSLRYMSSEIATQCKKTGLPIIEGGSVVDFQSKSFIPGEPLELLIKCNLNPQISYGKEGYKKIKIEIPTLEEYKQLKTLEFRRNLQERFRVIENRQGYRAREDDAVLVDMRGYLLGGENRTTRGETVESLCTKMNVILTAGRAHPGLVEVLLGCCTGDSLTTEVSFEEATEGPSVLLRGSKVSLDLTVLGISSLPAWGESLARAIHPDLNLTAVNQQVEQQVLSGAEDGLRLLRNEALAEELLQRVNTTKIPDVLVRNALAVMYQAHLENAKSLGLNLTSSRETVEEYRLVNQGMAERSVCLALVLQDIAKREMLRVEESEIQLAVEDYGKKMDARNQTVDLHDPHLRKEIEDSLLRVIVFEFLARN